MPDDVLTAACKRVLDADEPAEKANAMMALYDLGWRRGRQEAEERYQRADILRKAV